MRRLCRFWVPDPEFHFSLIHRENKMFLLYSFIILTGILLSEAQTRDTKVCTIKEMMELCVQREVIGVQGEDAILPCLFRHNEGNNTSELVFILYKDNDFIYDSMSSSKGRIQIVGNPSEGDGTVRIRDLKMEDEGMYGCGFRFKKLGDQQFTTIFTNKERRSELRVHVRPKILRIWREFMKSSNNVRLFCEAEAKPRPNMTWWNPNGHPVNGSYSMDIPNNQRYSQKIISSYNITRENPEGNYSCLVQNQYGAVNGFVLYKEGEETSEERGITKIVIGCSLSLILILLLFLFGFLIYKKQWNPTEGNPNHLEDIPEMGLKDEPSYMTLRKKHCDVNESHLYDMLSS